MAKLLPQQVEQLKKAKEILQQRRMEYVNACNDYDKLANINCDGVTDLNNLYDVEQIAVINLRIQEIDKLLKDYEVIKKETILNSSKIEIGTIFQATVVSEEETTTEIYQLLEELTDFQEDDEDIIPISLQTVFGISIYGKEEGATFNYRTKTNKFSGTIDKIYGLSLRDVPVKTR